MLPNLQSIRHPRRNPFKVVRDSGLLCLLFLAGVAPGHSQGQFSSRLWRAENGLPVNEVRSIVQGADGHLWIATPEGVLRFDGFRFETATGLPPLPPGGNTLRLFATSDGGIWLASSTGGLSRIDGLAVTKSWSLPGGPGTSPITQLTEGPAGQILVRWQDQVWSLNGESLTLIDSPREDQLSKVASDLSERARSGRLDADGKAHPLTDRGGSRWVPGEETGLTVTSPGGMPRPVALPNIGTGFEVTEMLEDREGNIWVATKLFGLALFREDRAEIVAVSGDQSTATVIREDSRGNVWVALEDGGVRQFGKDAVRNHDLPGRIATLYEDRSGGLWAGTKDGPLLRWMGWRFVEQFFEELPRGINAMYQDPDGVLWLGGPGGLFRVTGQQVTGIGSESGFPGGEVTVITGGEEGELWLGTVDGFILKNRLGRIETVGLPVDTGYTRISQILAKDPTRVWVSTLGSGLYLFSGNKWHHFGKREGLPETTLTALVDDENGHLWIGSSNGIYRVRESELVARSQNPLTPIHWLRMDRPDEQPPRECVGGHTPSVWRTRDGNIWFPTTKGAVRVDSSRTRINRTPPMVYLDLIKADGIPLEPAPSGLTAGPGKSRLEFEFHGLNFSAPEKVSYRTRLEGYEDDWRELGPRRRVAYEGIPPGNYSFSVIATNAAGLESRSAASITLTVRPNFWQTGWFILQVSILVIVLAGFIGWLIARNRMKQRLAQFKIDRAREAERARIARDLHDDLGASLTEISLMAGLSAEMAEGSDFQESLEDLSTRSQEVSQALDEIVWAANPTEDTFVSLIDYIAGFAHEFMDRAGITLRLDVPSDLPDSPMDTTLRHSIFLAVREAFNNIAKHSKAATAWLGITLTDQVLTIRVADDGCGISEDVLERGDGLRNFHERMESCGGEFKLTDRPEGGTVLEFKVPLA